MTKKVRRSAVAVAAASAMALGAVAVGTSSAAPHHSAATHSAARSEARSAKAVRLRNQMRKLWEDHIVWTRQFIVSSVADLPDVQTAAGRLLANQDHIGDAVKPYYGEEAGEQLSTLLRDHILIAAELLDAAKKGDSAAVEDAKARWYANANDISDFLGAANPKYWPRDEMRSMMAEHLDWTLSEAVARLNADWDADVAAYDHIHKDILHMADMLSRGLIAQFPEKF